MLMETSVLLSNCPDRSNTASLSAWESLAEWRIPAAREAGHFENLGGCGQPLQLCDDPYREPGGPVLSGVVEVVNLCVTKHMKWALIRVARINKRIVTFNGVAPLLQLQLSSLNLRREMQRTGTISR